MELKIIEQSDAFTHLALAGRLDAAGVKAVESALTNAVADAGKPAIIDLDQVSFIASMGMRLLISCAQALARTNAALVLLRPQPAVEDALRLVGFGKVIRVAQSQQEAMALLSSGATQDAG